jgi:hypothetical protein
MVYPALLPLMLTPRLPAVDWTDAPADLNGLVRFAERRNLFSARVPSHFKSNQLYEAGCLYKLTVSHILKNLRAIYRIWKFIAVSTKSCSLITCLNRIYKPCIKQNIQANIWSEYKRKQNRLEKISSHEFDQFYWGIYRVGGAKVGMVTYNKCGGFVKHIENVVRKYEKIMSLRRRNR